MCFIFLCSFSLPSVLPCAPGCPLSISFLLCLHSNSPSTIWVNAVLSTKSPPVNVLDAIFSMTLRMKQPNVHWLINVQATCLVRTMFPHSCFWNKDSHCSLSCLSLKSFSLKPGLSNCHVQTMHNLDMKYYNVNGIEENNERHRSIFTAKDSHCTMSSGSVRMKTVTGKCSHRNNEAWISPFLLLPSTWNSVCNGMCSAEK